MQAKQRIVNVLGALGYCALCFQWLWAGVTLAIPIASNNTVRQVFLPPVTTQSDTSLVTSIALPQPLEIAITIAAVVFAFAVIIYAIVAVPRSVGRSGKKITTVTAKVAAPYVTHHKKISKKHEKRLIERLTWLVKIILIAIPLALLLIPTSSQLGLSHTIVLICGLLLASISILWFGLQYVLVRVWKIETRHVW